MTTVVSPGSSPVPVYNKSGVTIDSITAAASPSPTQIARYAGTTVVLVDNGGDTNNQVQLPVADIGDVVELYAIAPSSGFHVAADSGSSFNLGGSLLSIFNVMVVRKTSASVWSVMSDT